MDKMGQMDMDMTLNMSLGNDSLPLFLKEGTFFQFFYPSNMYDEYTQYIIYDETNFIANFGGYLGLLLGSSVLTFYDGGKIWMGKLYLWMNSKFKSATNYLYASYQVSTSTDRQMYV